jgi:hypothetical protein
MPSGWKNYNRDEYHPNFVSRARRHKRRAKYTCEKCGAKRGETRLSKAGNPYKVMVAAAHVNHDPRNPRAKLIILCQICHLDYDIFDHAKKIRRTYHRKEREKQLENGQLELPLKFKGRPCKTQ